MIKNQTGTKINLLFNFVFLIKISFLIKKTLILLQHNRPTIILPYLTFIEKKLKIKIFE